MLEVAQYESLTAFDRQFDKDVGLIAFRCIDWSVLKHNAHHSDMLIPDDLQPIDVDICEFRQSSDKLDGHALLGQFLVNVVDFKTIWDKLVQQSLKCTTKLKQVYLGRFMAVDEDRV